MTVKIPFEVWRQHIVPQGLISTIYGVLSHCRWAWFKNWAIKRFIRLYGINVNEAAQTEPTAYPSFHEFFIRELNPNLRPIDRDNNVIVSPCDGTISQIGTIEQGTLIQAKGRHYSVSALLGGDHPMAEHFKNGRFATVYLAPKDYHRVHMPYAGTLRSVRYVPGKLFSVNPITAEHVECLFAKNERVVSVFDSPQGPFVVVLIGAMIVGSITTVANGTLTPPRGKKVVQFDYTESSQHSIKLDKGDEMGYFSLGSTVIMLFTDGLRWEQELAQHTRIVVGQRIGHYSPQ
jgi:phosphatidylserine decarboxylase